ncbi:tryptophan-rich sensory protein [Acuticoccus sp. M5D2P5]|uniref:TspO/MBR family protein n=1 Tax=Acuticoccus kalidii TaxID=2910977 RepID=UPI001F1F9084|nr:TspO/MBR family protein [Acuticoccus kalidii]MCF3932661.1 tryptophan-rich sensory protein [Acuticoccus kalidii]
MIESWPVLLMVVAANLTVVASGAAFPPDRRLGSFARPRWAAPDWALGPIWGILFVLVAASGYIFIVSATPAERVWPLVIYGLQLALMASWGPIAFGLRRLDLAAFVAILTCFMTFATILAFFCISPGAALLLLPYIVWMIYAATLTIVLWRRNMSGPNPAND